MKRLVLIIAAMVVMGASYAQVGKFVGKGILHGIARGWENGNQAVKNAENNAKRQIQIAPNRPVVPNNEIVTPKLHNPNEIKAISFSREIPKMPSLNKLQGSHIMDDLKKKDKSVPAK